MRDLPPPAPFSEINPYAPPLTPVAVGIGTVERSEPEVYEIAPKTRRFVNWLIDRAAIYGSIFAAGAVLGLLESEGLIGPLDWLEDLNRLEDLALTYAIVVLYYGGLESLSGRTLGKLITGTEVVDDEGYSPSAGTLFLRSLYRLVPLEPLSLLFGSGAWHDQWSKTQVIKVRKKKTPKAHKTSKETKIPSSLGRY